MPDFVKLAATAKRLVEANGRLVTLRRYDYVPANAAQPWRGPDDEPTAPDGSVLPDVRAAFVPPGGGGLGLERVVSPELGESYEQFAFIAAGSLPEGTDLEEFDTVQDGAKVWRIERASRLQPADVPLLFVLGLRS